MVTNKEKLNIWIVFQYLMPPEYEVRFRNIQMAEYLIEKGHNVLLVGGSYLHNQHINLVEGREPFVIREYQGLKFAHIKIGNYVDNGIKRIWSLIQFQTRLYRLARKIAAASGNIPDVMICDDAPFPFYREIKTAERLGAKVIKEVRDLWPESLVAYGFLKRGSLLAKYIYHLERKIYERADRLVFTMEGGQDYIIDKGWDLDSGGRIDLSKVHYINNGVDLDSFDRLKSQQLDDKYERCFSDLVPNFVYAGSIRLANDLERIVKPVSDLLDEGIQIHLTIFGDGQDRARLEKQYARHRNHIHFCGSVPKTQIPSLLKKADICVLCYVQTDTYRYGGSQNKLFEYFAASKPVLSLVSVEYDLIERYQCGVVAQDQTVDAVKNAIKMIIGMDKIERDRMGQMSREVAEMFDFRVLMDRLILVIEELCSR